MQYIRKVKTADGVEHDSPEAARKYLDEKFGAIIVPLARTIAEIDKFKAALEFAEKSVGEFVKLYELLQDMNITNEEDEDDAR